MEHEKNKKKKKLVIGVWYLIFAFFIIIPAIIFLLKKDSNVMADAENRALAQNPNLVVGNYKSFANDYTNYVNDHIPFRSELIKWNSLIAYKIFGTSTAENVLIGEEEWLFYKTKGLAGDPEADYKGILRYDQVYMENSMNHLLKLHEDLEKKGIELVVLIPPNKENIYYEYLPENIKRVGSTTQTDELVTYYRKNSNLNIVYPKEEMLKYKDKYQLYFKQDTHWNQLGAFIGEQQVVESLYNEREYLEDYDVCAKKWESRDSARKDLANMINMPVSFFKTDDELCLEKYKNYDRWDSDFLLNVNARYQSKVLLVGDSFRRSLKPYFQNDFSETQVMEYVNFSMRSIEQYQPDIVILEYVERSSGSFFDLNID